MARLPGLSVLVLAAVVLGLVGGADMLVSHLRDVDDPPSPACRGSGLLGGRPEVETGAAPGLRPEASRVPST
ncbi:hypothetical protein [Micromonospora sp. MH99]|uniref:hypothetical protein n=1 Tax=Micromonospora sp. MH99 TaxID=1945510 RepID=UPI001F1BC9FE|nr:hypothetical protein [Micromonospora sp. MH99]